MNLLSNAFKFTDSGHITVTVRCEPEAPSKEAATSCCSAGTARGGTAATAATATTATATATKAVNNKSTATAAIPVADDAYSSRPAASVTPTLAPNATTSDSLPSSFAKSQPRKNNVRAKISSKVLPLVSPTLGREGKPSDRSGAGGSGNAGLSSITAPVSLSTTGGSSEHRSPGNWEKFVDLVADWLAGGPSGSRKSEGGHVRGGKPSFLRSLEAAEYRRATLVVEVSDTGVGMTAEQIDRLFNPFSQVCTVSVCGSLLFDVKRTCQQ